MRDGTTSEERDRIKALEREVTIAALDTAEKMRALLEALANDDESDFRRALDPTNFLLKLHL